MKSGVTLLKIIKLFVTKGKVQTVKSMALDVGKSENTVREWMYVLQKEGIVRELPLGNNPRHKQGQREWEWIV